MLRKITAISMVIAITLQIVGMILIPSPVIANVSISSPNPDMNSLCWKEEECYKQRAQFGITDKKAQAAGCIKESPCNIEGWCKCLPAGKSKTSIGIGGKRDFQHLGEYIRIGFNYAIMMAGVIAVLMIVVSGIQWMVSGGDKNTITNAKKRIGGAFVGLFLAYGSIFILNQINPALTSLRLPQVWMVRQLNLGRDPRCPEGAKKDVAVTMHDCEYDCDCKEGWTCVGMNEGFATYLAKGVVWGAVAVVGGVAAPGVASTGGKAVWNGATKAGQGIRNYILKGPKAIIEKMAKLPEVKKYIIQHPVKAVAKGTVGVVKGAIGLTAKTAKKGAITYAGAQAIIYVGPKIFDNDKVENGHCIPLAKGTVGAGGLCAFDFNCANGKKCITGDSGMLSSWYTLSHDGIDSKGIGYCAFDSKVYTGTFKCSTVMDCRAETGPGSGVSCVRGVCSFGGSGDPCCESKGNPKNLGDYVVCKSQAGCADGYTCAFNMSGEWIPTGRDYGGIDCNDKTYDYKPFCNVYKNVIKNERGYCTENRYIKY